MGREIMSQIKNWQDGSSGDSATNSGTLTSSGTLAITGNVTLDGAAGTSGQVLTSAGTGTPTWVTPTLTTFVSGMIILWSGSEASIPAGWLLCDGTSSTPDLRNKFVVGASAGTGDTTYPGLSVGAAGGSATAVVVDHTHTTSITDSGHKHKIASAGSYNSGDFLAQLYSPGSGSNSYTLASKSGTADLYDSSLVTTGITATTANFGVSATNANLPPYYALAYIMKS